MSRHSERYQVVEMLVPARRAIGVARLQRWTLRGIGCGAVVALVFLAAAHVHAFSGALPASLLIVLIGGVAGVIAGVVQWPALAEAARLSDRHFDLKDRMTTALEFRGSNAPVVKLQRTELRDFVAGLALKQSRRGQLRWRETSLMLTALALFSGFAVLGGVPTPASAVSASGQDQSRIQQAAVANLPAITIAARQNLSAQDRKSPALQQLDLRLALLRHQLLQAKSRSSALRAISLTQQQFQRLAARLQPVDSASIRQLNTALAQFASRQQSGQGRTSGTDPLTAARSLRNLVNSLSKFSPVQRANVARLLAQLANSVKDPRVREALHQAASALANNDPPTASRALQRAVSFLASTPPSILAKSRLKAASQQLQRLKDTIAGIRPTTGRASSGRAGSGSTKSSSSTGGKKSTKAGSRGQSTARGSGVGGGGFTRGQPGPAPGLAEGSGSSTTNGKVSGLTTRSAGEGGRVTEDPTASISKRKQSNFATVYVPGVQGKGAHAIQTGRNSTPDQGVLISYRQVIARYTRTAHAALDRSSLPPAIQAYVRQYFEQLSR